MQYYSIKKEEWDNALEALLLSHTIFATISNGSGEDYELIKPHDVARISYNKPKPATSLKSFFLPVKENVTTLQKHRKPVIIIGVPNCDIEGLYLTDTVYLDEEFKDIFYSERRKNTLLISSDCLSHQEHCHCNTYDIKPYATKGADLGIVLLDNVIFLRHISEKGSEFIKNIPEAVPVIDDSLLKTIEKAHRRTQDSLNSLNSMLPDYRRNGTLIRRAGEDVWSEYSSKCVSCGACAAICPTCTCFLLIDKTGFEKVRQMDSCQYPGFERMAGGEDSLFSLPDRFRNRYFCKYIWKPERSGALACTGCGRCIEACIGKINKNTILLDLAKNAQ